MSRKVTTIMFAVLVAAIVFTPATFAADFHDAFDGAGDITWIQGTDDSGDWAVDDPNDQYVGTNTAGGRIVYAYFDHGVASNQWEFIIKGYATATDGNPSMGILASPQVATDNGWNKGYRFMFQNTSNTYTGEDEGGWGGTNIMSATNVTVYMKVQRNGDTLTFSSSTDGTSYTNVQRNISGVGDGIIVSASYSETTVGVALSTDLGCITRIDEVWFTDNTAAALPYHDTFDGGGNITWIDPADDTGTFTVDTGAGEMTLTNTSGGRRSGGYFDIPTDEYEIIVSAYSPNGDSTGSAPSLGIVASRVDWDIYYYFGVASNGQKVFIGENPGAPWVGGGTPFDGSPSGRDPIWLKLVRVGTVMDFYISQDGSTWTLKGSIDDPDLTGMNVGVVVETDAGATTILRDVWVNAYTPPVVSDYNLQPTTSLVTVDGSYDTTEWPLNTLVNSYGTTDKIFPGNSSWDNSVSDADISGDVYMQWDADSLYILAVVTDDVPTYPALWGGDYFDASADGTQLAWASDGSNHDAVNTTVASSTSATEIIYEIAIDWAGATGNTWGIQDPAQYSIRYWIVDDDDAGPDPQDAIGDAGAQSFELTGTPFVPVPVDSWELY